MDDEAILWVKTGDHRIQVKDRYNIDFFVAPDKVSQEKLTFLFDKHDNLAGIEKVERFLSIESTVKEPVLRVSVDSPRSYRKLTKLVGRYGELFDDGLSHTQRYLADRGLIPYGKLMKEYRLCFLDFRGHGFTLQYLLVSSSFFTQLPQPNYHHESVK